MSEEAAVKQAADQARAVLTDMILEDFESDSQYAGVAAAHRAELRGETVPPSAPAMPAPPAPSAAHTETVEHEAATEAEAPTDEETIVPSFSLEEPEVPADLRAFLDEPDFDAEAEAELATAAPSDESNDFDEEYLSDETQAERKKRLAAEKKIQWLEARLADTNRQKWEAEALKYFPYAEHSIGSINATSRRQFLRDAEKAHQAMRPHIEAYLKKAGTVVQKTAVEAREQAQVEVKNAWGNPTVDAANAVASEAAFEAEVATSRKESRSLEEHFKRLIRASTEKK